MAELQFVTGGWLRGYASRESSTSKILHLVGRRHLLLPNGSVLVHPVILRFAPPRSDVQAPHTTWLQSAAQGGRPRALNLPKRSHKRDPRRAGRRGRQSRSRQTPAPRRKTPPTSGHATGRACSESASRKDLLNRAAQQRAKRVVQRKGRAAYPAAVAVLRHLSMAVPLQCAALLPCGGISRRQGGLCKDPSAMVPLPPVSGQEEPRDNLKKT